MIIYIQPYIYTTSNVDGTKTTTTTKTTTQAKRKKLIVIKTG